MFAWRFNHSHAARIHIHIQVVKRLRLIGEPATLFGETDMERLLRLRQLQHTGNYDMLVEQGTSDQGWGGGGGGLQEVRDGGVGWGGVGRNLFERGGYLFSGCRVYSPWKVLTRDFGFLTEVTMGIAL